MRIPRPQGLTLQLKEIRKTNDIKEKRKCLQYIIAQGFILNGKNIDMHQISQLLNLPLKDIIKELGKGFRALDVIGDDMARIYREGLSMAFFGALEDRHKIKAQEEMLVRAQGGQYVPFLTAQVGQAQNNLLNSQKSLIMVIEKVGQALAREDAAKASGAELPTQGTQYLTTQEALRLLEPQTLPLSQVATNLERPKLISVSAFGENPFALQAEASEAVLVNETYKVNMPLEPEPVRPQLRHTDRNEAFDAEIILPEDLDEDEDDEAFIFEAH